MKYIYRDIVLLEVPDEISLCYTISGCTIHCTDCHSPELWNSKNGNELTLAEYRHDLSKYANYITCVLFMGGEWNSSLVEYLCHAHHDFGLKTCLYTGVDDIELLDPLIIKNLTYLKYGKYVNDLGGLEKITTNQQFINVQTGEILNKKFQTIGDVQ